MHLRERARTALARGRRARLGTTVAMLLALFASSCTALDVKPAVAVQKLPLDLKFGAQTGEEDGQEEVAPPAPPPPVEIPDIKPPPPPPPQPKETCIFTQPSIDRALEPTISEDSNGASYLFRSQFWGHDEKEPSQRWVFGDPKKTSVRPGTEPNTLVRVEPQGVGQPRGYLLRQREGHIGMDWVFQVAFGEDVTTGETSPDVGFFLNRLGIPPERGVPPEMDDTVSQTLASGGDGLFFPQPRMKLFSFPVLIGREYTSQGYDPFLRTAAVSRTLVVDEERVRECDEHVSAWKVDWQLQLHGFYEHEIRGTFWFATQYGGMIVKADYCSGAPSTTAEGVPSTTDPCEDESFSGAPLLSGFVRQNVHNIEPYEGP